MEGRARQPKFDGRERGRAVKVHTDQSIETELNVVMRFVLREQTCLY